MTLGATWAYRAERELESEARFARLVNRLERTGGNPAVIDMARRAVADERRHAGQCTALARRFGVTAAPVPDELGEVAPSTWDLRDRVLYETVAFACIAETLNVALLMEELREGGDPEVRETTHSILRDEVQHARFGWAHLHAEQAAGRGDILAPYLPTMLAHSQNEEVPERFALFQRTVRTVILPGFQHAGIDTTAAGDWLASL